MSNPFKEQKLKNKYVGMMLAEDDYVGMVLDIVWVDFEYNFTVEWYTPDNNTVEHNLGEEFIIDRGNLFINKYRASSSVG